MNDIYNAEHPARQTAIKIIEKVIEPMVGKGINGEEYYDLEDKITFMIAEKNEAVKSEDMNYDEYKEFPITSVCHTDLKGIGFDCDKVDDGTMIELASKMADAYCDCCFWSNLEIIAENLGIKKLIIK